VSARVFILMMFAAVPGAVVSEDVAARFLEGCKQKSLMTFYPPNMIRLDTEGRVLLEVERSRKGRLRVVKAVSSEPEKAFDSSATELLSSFRCEELPEPVTGTVSITFSLKPGTGVAHFEGADGALEIRASRIGS
jgi:TonB family protein